EIDVNRIQKLGVALHLNTPVDRPLFERLQRDFDFLYLSVGAQAGKPLRIPGEELEGVQDALAFLSRVRKGEAVSLGQRVLVIGGGNTAIDAARTARRLVGQNGDVTLLYRRTRHEMPADADEIREALLEGVRLLELAAPVAIRREDDHLVVTCQKMALGEPDDSGRRRPVPVENSEFLLEADAVIPAIGQEMALDFLNPEDLKADPVTHETAIPRLYIGGDAFRGPSSLILSIADGKEAAAHILKAAGKDEPSRTVHPKKELTLAEFQKKAARREWAVHPKELPPAERLNFRLVSEPFTPEDARKEASRCLLCDEICNVCVGVCPNRANLSYTIQPVAFNLQKISFKTGKLKLEPDGTFRVDQRFQVLNIADWCNECGNCTTFCPTSGAPYRDKPKLCLSEASFREEPEAYRLEKRGEWPSIVYKKNGRRVQLTREADRYVYETGVAVVWLNRKNFSILQVEMTKPAGEIHLQQAAAMRIILDNLGKSYLMNVTY
ncbi:MAG: FAD-dependent oxidoreductase, partial [Calditrichaeota bacterium]|nr:FAD-dependent oxidoreductase [Calditrichota bacterium]